jgi:thymidylate synthase (FAD)
VTKFIFEPTVHVVAETKINWEGLQAWADDHGLTEVLGDNGTPLGVLWQDLYHDEKDVSLDALPEFAGRHCYRSFSKGRKREDYIKNIIDMEHGSVLEHSNISFAISGVSRSLTHELIRHRAGAAPSQESQRYVDAQDVNFVVPPLIRSLSNPDSAKTVYDAFENSCIFALNDYKSLIAQMESLTTSGDGSELGVKLATMRKKRILEAARSVLPNAAETRLTWTMNMRAARHVCALRGGEGADLEIRALAIAMLKQLKDRAPIIFSDFTIYTADDGFDAVHCEKPKV